MDQDSNIPNAASSRSVDLYTEVNKESSLFSPDGRNHGHF
jgi:hypothetical protein